MIFIHIKENACGPRPELPLDAPTFGHLVGELAFGIWLYDLAFFPIHVLLHKNRYGKKHHAYHHRAQRHALNAVETVQHSYVDGALQVAVNILVQQISPFGDDKHPLSRLLHNVLVTYLLCESHSGYDLPWQSHNLFPEIFGGAPNHEMHHHNGRVHYQQFFTYLDTLFGFVPQEAPRAADEDSSPSSRSEAAVSDTH